MESTLFAVSLVQLALILLLTVLLARAEWGVSSGESIDPTQPRRSGVSEVKEIEAAIVERSIALSRRNLLTVLDIKVDHLSLVADAFSDQVATDLVSAVGEIVRRQVRGSDDVTLLHGRELVVVSDELRTPDDVTRMCKRLLESFVQPVEFGGHSQKITVSVGVVWIQSGRKDARQLLPNARAAKNVAANITGNSLTVYDNDLREKAARKLQLEHDLATALKANDQVGVHYQAIVDLSNSQPRGYEALLRWFHPTLGTIDPHTIVSTAKHAHLTSDLSHYIADDACRRVSQWSQIAKQPVTVSINIAEGDLLDGGLHGVLLANLARYQISPGQIELELSESFLAEDLEFSKGALERLAGEGFRLAIDDFGAGAAPLGLIKSLPMLNTLKLDRTFISNLVDSPTEYELAKAVTMLAAELDIEVVAVGIEDESTAVALSQLGIKFGQGFLFQRPSPPEDIDALIKKHLTSVSGS